MFFRSFTFSLSTLFCSNFGSTLLNVIKNLKAQIYNMDKTSRKSETLNLLSPQMISANENIK